MSVTNLESDRYTYGEWQTEADACRAFDVAAEATGMFDIHREVRGHYISLRPGQELKTPRIDRVLSPKPALRDMGWTEGLIGVEIKKSGTKLGPAIAQMQDYTRAVWSLTEWGLLAHLTWIALWPMETAHGPLASLMAQQRLISASTDRAGVLELTGPQGAVFSASHNGVRFGIAQSGRKTGSR